MAGQRADLGLERIDAGAKIGFMRGRDRSRRLLRQRRAGLGAEERFQRPDRHLEVLHLLLEPEETPTHRIALRLHRLCRRASGTSSAGARSSWARQGSAARPSRSPAVKAKAGRVRLRHRKVDRATKDLQLGSRGQWRRFRSANAPNHNAFARPFGAKLRLGVPSSGQHRGRASSRPRCCSASSGRGDSGPAGWRVAGRDRPLLAVGHRPDPPRADPGLRQENP